jgi:hypothetical protein
MTKIEEGQKIKLKTGELAYISEVLYKKELGTGYIVEKFKKGGGMEMDTVFPRDIKSVIVEVEQPFQTAR